MNNLLLAVDGDNVLHHAYYGNKSDARPNGIRINGLVTFFMSINKIIRRGYYDHLFIGWDIQSIHTKRHKILEPFGLVYKGSRTENLTPEQIERRKDIHEQKVLVMELLTACGIPSYVSPIKKGDESDDIIASIAHATHLDCHIASTDKDMYQSISNKVKILNPNKGLVDLVNCIDVFGVDPKKVVDYLTLIGDDSDSLPGIDGCGPKTAIQWLEKYGNLKGVVANRHELKGKGGKTLQELPNADLLKAVRKCVRLNYNVFEEGHPMLDTDRMHLDTIRSHIKRNDDEIQSILKRLGITGKIMPELGL